MRTYTLTTDQLAEAFERAYSKGYDRSSAVSKTANPDDYKNTQAYHHFRCQDLEPLLFGLGGETEHG